jgi:aquaporin Z
MTTKLAAEFPRTFWVVLGGCGSAVLAATFPGVGIGLLGVALAFGLTVLTGVYAFGPISGGHFNPAVSVGLCAGGRFPAAQLFPYIVAQTVGAIVAACVLYLIASGAHGFDLAAGFASNGYGDHSPGKYSLTAALVTEIVMTFMFLMVIHGTTDRRAPIGFAGMAIGLCLTLIHLDQHPGHQHLGEPGTQHRTCALRRRLGGAAGVALLGRTDRGRVARRRGLPRAVRARFAGAPGDGTVIDVVGAAA